MPFRCEGLFFGRWVLYHLPYHPLNLSGFGKELHVDANNAAEIPMTKRPKRPNAPANESRRRAMHLRFADPSPEGLA
jgi:hypothetical protein